LTVQPQHADREVLFDILEAMVALALWDYQRGPGETAKQRKRYDSAEHFLRQTGLLDRIHEQHDQQAQREESSLPSASVER